MESFNTTVRQMTETFQRKKQLTGKIVLTDEHPIAI